MNRAVSFYTEKLGFTCQFVYGGFRAAIARDQSAIHLKCAPKAAADRVNRQQNGHLDVCIEVDDTAVLHSEFTGRLAPISQPLARQSWQTVDFHVTDPMVTCCVFHRVKLTRSLLGFRRIHIAGNAGSGKTTTAHSLSATLEIPAHSLDTLVWRPHWKKALHAERLVAENCLTSKSTWIIEGVSEQVREAADLMIYLDLPRHHCLYRALRRALRYIRTQRPEFPSDCPEWKILPTLARIIWRLPKLVGQKIEREAARSPEKYWVIGSDKDLDTLLETAGTTGCLLSPVPRASVDSRRSVPG